MIILVEDRIVVAKDEKLANDSKKTYGQWMEGLCGIEESMLLRYQRAEDGKIRDRGQKVGHPCSLLCLMMISFSTPALCLRRRATAKMKP